MLTHPGSEAQRYALIPSAELLAKVIGTMVWKSLGDLSSPVPVFRMLSQPGCALSLSTHFLGFAGRPPPWGERSEGRDWVKVMIREVRIITICPLSSSAQP